MTKNKSKKPRQKQVTLKDVEKEFGQLNKFSTYILDEETNAVIKYNAQFDNNKIEQLMKEAYEKLLYVEEKQISFFQDDDQFMKYICFLMIKYFTHFGTEIKDDLETQLIQMHSLVSIGLFETIISDVFDGNEVHRVLKKIEEFVSLVANTLEMEMDIRQNAEDMRANIGVIHPVVRESSGDA